MNRLYLRIWLAVVLAVAVLTLLVGWVWRMTTDAPLREVVARNDAGEVIGLGRLRARGPVDGGPAGKLERERFDEQVRTPVETAVSAEGPGPGLDFENDSQGRIGRGPEFDLHMQDGQILHIHMPRPGQSNWRAPFGIFWTLGLVGIAVALATYPIVRRLTRRLEVLQRSVERWGDGDLGVRVPIAGNDEVGFLADRFNHAAQQIENLVLSRDALLASQKSLLANASHELRSPLARIRMGLELMATPASASTDETKDEITRNIKELDQLIDEILLASRLDAREADMGTIESIDLVGLAAEECARAGVDFEPQTNGKAVMVPGVNKLLRRAVRNLLENARRHAAGSAVLHLSLANSIAFVRVCDNGPGVPIALQERIFEPFYRLPGASERDGGMGLGLALVKSIALRHNGEARCFNRDAGGACFEITLPLGI